MASTAPFAENVRITGLMTRGSELRRNARRRARRALGRDLPRNARPEPPPGPVGGKLEITYACNLRCGFCYTDSPRRTLQRTPELSDEEWLTTVDELIELGAIEAVVTGGEPLLRRELTIEVCRRLARAGLGVTLNSNGWFIDDATAAALAEAPGLHVHVSVDGPTPELHDSSRGVPGSWRRAIGGLDALIRHGVAVHAVHVVTEQNVGEIETTLARLHTLGVPAIRVTPVIEVGAAARDGGWRIALDPIEQAVSSFRKQTAGSVRVTLQSGEGATALIRHRSAPASLLVRPDGTIRTDSLHPFSYGHTRDGLAANWQRIREHWSDPEIDRWRAGISVPTDFAGTATVAYLDDEVAVGETPAVPAGDGDARSAPVPLPVAAGTRAATEAVRSVGDPAAHIEALAFGRRYRRGEVRAAGSPDALLVRRLADGRIWRLNRSASIVFGTLAGGTPADAARALGEAFPATAAPTLRDDALAATRRLARDGLVLPEAALSAPLSGPGPTADLPQLTPS